MLIKWLSLVLKSSKLYLDLIFFRDFMYFKALRFYYY